MFMVFGVLLGDFPRAALATRERAEAGKIRLDLNNEARIILNRFSLGP